MLVLWPLHVSVHRNAVLNDWKPIFFAVSGQRPTRTIPHRAGIGPGERVLLLGNGPGGEFVLVQGVVLGIMVALVGNSRALFVSGGKLSPLPTEKLS